MKIVFDILFAADGVTPLGTQFIDLDPAAPATTTPDNGKTLMTPLQFVASIQANKAALQQAGFLEPTRIPGHPVGTTKWAIIVAEANKPTAIPEVKALALT